MNDDLKYIDEFVSQAIGEIEIQSPPTGGLAWRISIFSAAVMIFASIVYFSFFIQPPETNPTAAKKSDVVLNSKSDSVYCSSKDNSFVSCEENPISKENHNSHSSINPFNREYQNEDNSGESVHENNNSKEDVNNTSGVDNENITNISSGAPRDTVKTMIITDTVKVVVQPDVVRQKKKHNRRD